MKEKTRPRIPRSCLGHRRMLVALVTGVAFLTGYAVTQTEAGKPMGSDSASTASQIASAAANAGAEATADPDNQDGEPKTDPRPRWVCDQQTATAEAIWRGESSLTFAFDIRNQGTADLKINARGG